MAYAGSDVCELLHGLPRLRKLTLDWIGNEETDVLPAEPFTFSLAYLDTEVPCPKIFLAIVHGSTSALPTLHIDINIFADETVRRFFPSLRVLRHLILDIGSPPPTTSSAAASTIQHLPSLTSHRLRAHLYPCSTPDLLPTLLPPISLLSFVLSTSRIRPLTFELLVVMARLD